MSFSMYLDGSNSVSSSVICLRTTGNPGFRIVSTAPFLSDVPGRVGNEAEEPLFVRY
jgi:hypothetical protein